MRGDIYSGNDFSIEKVGNDWRIWRFCDDEGGQEQIILTTQAMDELRIYFADLYLNDRGKRKISSAAQREP